MRFGTISFFKDGGFFVEAVNDSRQVDCDGCVFQDMPSCYGYATRS